MFYCMNCGKPINDNNKICSLCGNNQLDFLITQSEDANASIQIAQNINITIKDTRNYKKIIGYVLLALLIWYVFGKIVKKSNPVTIIEINQENCMRLDGMASDAAQLSAAAIGVSGKSVSFVKPKWIDWSKHCNVIIDTPKGSFPCKVEAILDDNGVIFADLKNFLNEATCNNPFIN